MRKIWGFQNADLRGGGGGPGRRSAQAQCFVRTDFFQIYYTWPQQKSKGARSGFSSSKRRNHHRHHHEHHHPPEHKHQQKGSLDHHANHQKPKHQKTQTPKNKTLRKLNPKLLENHNRKNLLNTRNIKIPEPVKSPNPKIPQKPKP